MHQIATVPIVTAWIKNNCPSTLYVKTLKPVGSDAAGQTIYVDDVLTVAPGETVPVLVRT